MNLTNILLALSGQHDGGDPARWARLGFLEWLGSAHPDADPTHEAQAAVIRMDHFIANAPAVAHFRCLLAAAAEPLPTPRRRGGRKRMLN